MAENHRESILKTCSDLGSKSKVVVGEDVETYAKILVHTIFFECFLIRNELFGLVQDGQQETRVVESLLFRSLDSCFSPLFLFPRWRGDRNYTDRSGVSRSSSGS
jgi:hypothetical protein